MSPQEQKKAPGQGEPGAKTEQGACIIPPAAGTGQAGAIDGADPFLDAIGWNDDQQPAAAGHGVTIKLNEDLPTERGIAEIVASAYADRHQYIPATATWLVSDGIAMRPDRLNSIRHLVAVVIRDLHHLVDQTADLDFKRREAIRKALGHIDNARGIGGIVKRLESDPRMTRAVESFDADPDLLNVANGVVNLRTGELLPADPTRWTRATAARYLPECDQVPERFMAFLLELCAGRVDLLAWLWRVIGYSLTGHIDAHIVVAFQGSGRNGKTTLFDIMRQLLGTWFRVADPAVLLERQDKASHPVADLEGYRVALVAETARGESFDIGRLKQLTGEPVITARGLYQANRQIRNTVHLFVYTNGLPSSKAADNGFYARFRPIPCDHNVRPDQINPNLADEIVKAEGDLILTAAIRQARLWYTHGLPPLPECMVDILRVYRDDNDRLAAFLADAIDAEPGCVSDGACILAAYNRWTERHGEQALGKRHFYQALEERGFRRQLDRDRRVQFRGIQLRGTV